MIQTTVELIRALEEFLEEDDQAPEKRKELLDKINQKQKQLAEFQVQATENLSQLITAKTTRLNDPNVSLEERQRMEEQISVTREQMRKYLAITEAVQCVQQGLHQSESELSPEENLLETGSQRGALRKSIRALQTSLEAQPNPDQMKKEGILLPYNQLDVFIVEQELSELKGKVEIFAEEVKRRTDDNMRKRIAGNINEIITTLGKFCEIFSKAIGEYVVQKRDGTLSNETLTACIDIYTKMESYSDEEGLREVYEKFSSELTTNVKSQPAAVLLFALIDEQRGITQQDRPARSLAAVQEYEDEQAALKLKQKQRPTYDSYPTMADCRHSTSDSTPVARISFDELGSTPKFMPRGLCWSQSQGHFVRGLDGKLHGMGYWDDVWHIDEQQCEAVSRSGVNYVPFDMTKIQIEGNIPKFEQQGVREINGLLDKSGWNWQWYPSNVCPGGYWTKSKSEGSLTYENLAYSSKDNKWYYWISFLEEIPNSTITATDGRTSNDTVMQPQQVTPRETTLDRWSKLNDVCQTVYSQMSEFDVCDKINCSSEIQESLKSFLNRVCYLEELDCRNEHGDLLISNRRIATCSYAVTYIKSIILNILGRTSCQPDSALDSIIKIMYPQPNRYRAICVLPLSQPSEDFFKSYVMGKMYLLLQRSKG